MTTSSKSFMQNFARLIGTPSVSSIDPAHDQSNRQVIDLLGDWFDDLGFSVELMPVSRDPDKFNLIACRGEGEGGLVLAGHTDTVPYNESAWQQDPFSLTERDNRLYGLGTSDMKCFFPLIVEALQRLETSGFRHPLYILATADEESNMTGARALVDSGKTLGRYALIGEPTGLKPVYQHKGILMESVRLTGKSGHSSDPSLGRSALEGMHHVMTRLMEWRRKLQQDNNNGDFRVPGPTLNFGSIRGGDNPNRICAECVLTLDLRLLPGMQLETVRSELYEQVSAAVRDTGLEVECRSLFGGVPALETPVESEIVRIAEKLSGSAAGSVAFGTEGPYLNAMDMSTVILGPGDIEQAHQANEFLPMERIAPMLTILTGMIRHFCSGKSV